MCLKLWRYLPKSSRDNNCEVNNLFIKKIPLVIGYGLLPLKGPRFVFRYTLEVVMVRTLGWNHS